MQVNLPEKFLSPEKHKVYVVKNFLIVCYLVFNHSCILNNSLMTDLAEINFRVYQVSVNIVQLIQIKIRLLITHDVKQPSFFWVLLLVPLILPKN